MHLPLKIDLAFKEFVLSYLGDLKDDPNEITYLRTIDEALREYWFQEITDETNKSIGIFRKCVIDVKPKKDGIEIPDEYIQDVIKSCSALRLFVRRTALKDLTDDELENSNIKNPTDEQKIGLIVYILLVEIQTYIIENLQP